METNHGGTKVKCYLCEELFDKNETTVIYGRTIYTLCNSCRKEHDQHLKETEKYLNQIKVKKLKEWLRERRVVKRFYRNQLPLPLNGEGK